jgi:hypothetical protein
VVVLGLWSSPDQAILSAVLPDFTFGVLSFSVSKVTPFPVKIIHHPEPGIMLVYNSDDIDNDLDPEDPSLLIDDKQNVEFERLDMEIDAAATPDNAEYNVDIVSWIVKVTYNHTPLNFSDDHYYINGGGQYVNVTQDGKNTASGLYQLGLSGIHVSSACSSNPLGGFAVVQELRAGDETSPDILPAASAVFYFDGNCNSYIKVLQATGNYVAVTDSSLNFNLNQP